VNLGLFLPAAADVGAVASGTRWRARLAPCPRNTDVFYDDLRAISQPMIYDNADPDLVPRLIDDQRCRYRELVLLYVIGCAPPLGLVVSSMEDAGGDGDEISSALNLAIHLAPAACGAYHASGQRAAEQLQSFNFAPEIRQRPTHETASRRARLANHSPAAEGGFS